MEQDNIQFKLGCLNPTQYKYVPDETVECESLFVSLLKRSKSQITYLSRVWFFPPWQKKPYFIIIIFSSFFLWITIRNVYRNIPQCWKSILWNELMLFSLGHEQRIFFHQEKFCDSAILWKMLCICCWRINEFWKLGKASGFLQMAVDRRKKKIGDRWKPHGILWQLTSCFS